MQPQKSQWGHGGNPTDLLNSLANDLLKSRYLKEVDEIVAQSPKCCGGPDFEAAKKELEKDWLPRAKTYLEGHGLTCDLYTWYQSNGQSGRMLCNLRIFEQQNQQAQVVGAAVKVEGA